MARGPNEKNISGDLPEELFNEVERFLAEHRNCKKKQLLAVALELFLSLEPQQQALALFEPRDSERFQEVVREAGRRLESKDPSAGPAQQIDEVRRVIQASRFSDSLQGDLLRCLDKAQSSRSNTQGETTRGRGTAAKGS